MIQLAFDYQGSLDQVLMRLPRGARAPGTPAGARWCAEIKVNGRRLRKYAQSEVEAALKYNEMAVEHFAAFARLNNVPTGRGDCR